MNSMTLHEFASRLRDVVAPFAAADELEDMDDDLFVGEEGIALSAGLRIAVQHGVAVPGLLLASLHDMRDDLAADQIERLDSLSRAVA